MSMQISRKSNSGLKDHGVCNSSVVGVRQSQGDVDLIRIVIGLLPNTPPTARWCVASRNIDIDLSNLYQLKAADFSANCSPRGS